MPEVSTPSGGADTADGPVRTCVGCRARGNRGELMRFVAWQGRVEPDPQRRRPGRGVYLHVREECVALALRRRPWSRAFRVSGPLDDTPIRQWWQDLASC